MQEPLSRQRVSKEPFHQNAAHPRVQCGSTDGPLSKDAVTVASRSVSCVIGKLTTPPSCHIAHENDIDNCHDPPQAGGLLLSVVPRGISPSTFRYWIDFQVLSSPESAKLTERALRMLGGERTGGPPKTYGPDALQVKIKDYGYMHMDAWDLLWSITAKAMLAAEILRPGQLVSIIPGCLSITRKTSLVRTLRNTYGDQQAFTLVPRTFKLPEELDAWSQWVQLHPEKDTGLWMLKNNKQRGTGLRLVPTAQAFAACFETTTRPGLEGLTLYRWYLAQQYITNPLLIHGRKFGIRVWVVVPDIDPLRAYIHERGLALFSSSPYNLSCSTTREGEVASGHVTNYAQNEDGWVWSLEQLSAWLGPEAYLRLWTKICDSCAKVFASSLRRVKEMQSSMELRPHSCFQFFGLDYLVDTDMVPWLLEVNATPSMKVEHVDPDICQMIHDQKWPVVRDMFVIMGVWKERFKRLQQQEEGGPLRGKQLIREMERELARRGGFHPLMHLFPCRATGGLLSIPWQDCDLELRAWTHSKVYREHVAWG